MYLPNITCPHIAQSPHKTQAIHKHILTTTTQQHGQQHINQHHHKFTQITHTQGIHQHNTRAQYMSLTNHTSHTITHPPPTRTYTHNRCTKTTTYIYIS